MQNDHAKGDNKYPVNLEAAVEMVMNFRGGSNKGHRRQQERGATTNEQRESVAFAQAVAGRDGKTHARIECYSCHKKGHYADQCPEGASNANAQTTSEQESAETASTQASEKASTAERVPTRSGTNHVTITSWSCFTSRNIKEGVVMMTFKQKLRTWLLLDNQSTDNIFCNKDYLVNIRKTDATLDLTSNGGGLKNELSG